MGTFGFVVNTYQDTENLCRCMSSIRDHYPAAPIAVIDDGGMDGDLDLPASVYRVKLIRGGHLRPLVGPWIHRWLQAGVNLGTRYIIKMDPDSRLHRPFRHVPRTDAFGYEIDCWYGKYLHGGCKGFSHDCAVRLVMDDLVQRAERYIDKATARKMRGRKHPLSEDVVLSWILATEGFTQSSWGEVVPVPMTDAHGYAASHGHPSPTCGAKGLKP